MRKTKLVRCTLAREGDNLGEDDGNVRFVPLEEFKLWSFLMEKKHGFKIKKAEASLWFDEDVYEDWQKNYQKERLEPVKELIINWYSPADDAVLPIRRYILEKDFERVKEILMNHYPDSVIYEGKSEYTMKEVEERPGYFVRKAGG